MLWLNNAVEALQYAGLLRSGIVKPQLGLNNPLGTVNIREFEINTSRPTSVLTTLFRSLTIWQEQCTVHPSSDIRGSNRRRERGTRARQSCWYCRSLG
jgi:hypothetical protein